MPKPSIPCSHNVIRRFWVAIARGDSSTESPGAVNIKEITDFMNLFVSLTKQSDCVILVMILGSLAFDQ